MAKQDTIAHQLAQLFRVMGDPTRLRVLLAIRDGEKNVTELCNLFRLPQPTVSRHLGILRMSELVSSQRKGKQIFYSLVAAQGSRHGKVLRAILREVKAV